MASTDITTLTAAETIQASFRLFDRLADTSQGLSITFDFYSYGGSGGDGLSFIVLDGAAGTVTAAGGFGGSLGYANRDDRGVPTPGIAGGYIGIGFDEFGNYSKPTEGRNGGEALGNDSIAIRGSASQSYRYLTGADLPDGVSIDNPLPNSDRNSAKRSAKIDLTAAGILSVLVDFNGDGVFDDSGETNAALQNVDVRTANGGALPASLRFGFAAATGSSTNIHEFGNFKATTSSGVALKGSFDAQTVGGGAGNSVDNLTGGVGNDQIIGGGGSDVLTGNRGGDIFFYSGPTRFAALSQSTLKSLDRIRDFNFREGDRFQFDFDSQLLTSERPRGFFNAGNEKGTLKKAAKAAYADKSFTKRGNQKLKPGEAVLFTQGSRTYISVNDDNPVFSAGRDFLANVTNIKLKAGDSRLGTLNVNNYFI